MDGSIKSFKLCFTVVQRQNDCGENNSRAGIDQTRVNELVTNGEYS